MAWRFTLNILFFFLLPVFFLESSELHKEEEVVKRIYSHLTIRDYLGALEECEKNMEFPFESEKLKEAYVRSLAENGKDGEAISYWKKWKGEAANHDMLETLAWSILQRSENSRQLVINMASLMGAFYTHDVRAAQMIKHQMHSSNAILRAMAVQLSSQYRDETLIEELKRLFNEEKVWFVRLEVIKALGEIGSKEMKEELQKIVINSRSSAEEKGLAVTALVSLYEGISKAELRELVTSKRMGLRLLACEIIGHLDLLEEIPALLSFLEDPSPDLRVAALNTLYFLGLKHLSSTALQKIALLVDDPLPAISITASWMALRFSEEKALKNLKKWVYSPDEKNRRLAAFVLAHSNGGYLLAKEALHISPDPFVKANIALGLIRQERDIKESCNALYQFLKLCKDKMMWSRSGNSLFQILSPSEIHHIPQIPQYPTLIDQLTRLDILNFLAILKHPQAEEAVKSFLTHQVLGVSFAASSTLLEEGGEEAIDILRHLLKDDDEMIRIQSALVLALSGSEPEAINTLQAAYPKMDRDMKINILGAIGHIGDRKSIPFLFELLDEPYQVLKVVAASALIQCLYH